MKINVDISELQNSVKKMGTQNEDTIPETLQVAPKTKFTWVQQIKGFFIRNEKSTIEPS